MAAAARYWRVAGFETYGDEELELSEIQLWAEGARVDASATVTALVAPTSGSLSTLLDNTLSAVASWPRASYFAPGFGIKWDFGSATAVDRVRLGAGNTKLTFPYTLTLQQSSDGTTWTPVAASDTITYPGALTATLVGGYTPGVTIAALLYNGRDGSATLSEQTGKTVTAVGGAALTTTLVSAFGTNALNVNGLNKYVYLPGSATFALGTADFDFEIEVVLTGYPTNNAGEYRSALITKDQAGSRSFSWELVGTSSSITSMGLTLFNSAGGNTDVSVSYTFSLNTRYFLRVARVSGAVSFFINGSKIGSPQANGTDVPQGTAPIGIGQTLFNTTYFYQLYGYVGKTTMLVGSALDQADYTDSTTPFPNRIGMSPRVPYSRAATPLSRVRNFETGGNGYISGTVKVLGDPTNVPTRRRVRLLRDRDAMLVAETWSDAATGAYLFNEIDRTATYTVLTDDYEHSYRSVVADRITPSLMS